MSSEQNNAPTGSLEQALRHAHSLLPSAPRMAEQQAREILLAAPEHTAAQWLLGAALRRQGKIPVALDILEPLARREPRAPLLQFDLALALGAAGRGGEAMQALQRCLALKPDLPEAWLALGEHALATGDTRLADEAFARHLRLSAQDPRVADAALAMLDNRLDVAESLLREQLRAKRDDIAALRMLAELAARLGRYGDAATLLAQCLTIAPGFRAARYNYAFVLHRQNESVAALTELEQLLQLEPSNPGYRNLKAAVLARIGDTQQSLDLYAGVLAEYPDNARAWMSYGHALKAAGRQADAIGAYRRTLALAPGLGEAWWSLANLKTLRFTPEEIATIERQLTRKDLAVEDRYHFEFTLGKAREDSAEFGRSFEHYCRGNEVRRSVIHYSADETRDQVGRACALLSPDFFATRRGHGCVRGDPIFIVGLPRSGSTLLEQILASHPQVEGTQELPDLPALARRLAGRKSAAATTSYPESLADLTAAEALALGDEYLASTRIQRKTDRPFFIDKMPNNWLHIGLIQLILPRARIIDARRHPMACCWSSFKQHFARGQHFTYDLTDVGRYYRDYVRLLAHIDRVLPGRVHRVIYEQLVDNLEKEVRRLLRYCELPFDTRCLEFHRTERSVRTASSEQVRRPLFRDGMDHYRHFEPWLSTLREALGPALLHYPNAPPG